jgi:O-antigen/teichoic acid export membrane protein
LLYGGEYGSASRLIRIMLIGWIFYVVFIPFSFLFIALGDARTRFIIEFIKLALGITLLVILIPLYGAVGAAGAISLTYIAASFYGLIMAKYRIFNNFKREAGPLPGPVTQLAK